MATIKVVTGFTRLRDDVLDTRAQNIIDNLTNNARFPTPIPALADVSAALAAYRDALVQAKNGGKEKTALKNQKRDILIQMLNALALYVQANCQNDLAVLLSSGYEARKSGTPVGVLSKPENFKVENGPNPGSVRLSVEKVTGAGSYLFEYMPAPEGDGRQWLIKPGTARSCVIDDLNSGQQYAFRVAGVGADPTLVYSDVITRFVS